MITLADLRFIEALARAGSLSGAARSLNVTPPALSMRLTKLEQLLGVSLVGRSSRRVRFTGEAWNASLPPGSHADVFGFCVAF